ncbi:ABC transporter ATP-binding protein [Candidatus Enterococcus willemsii]|uniref:ABC transporter domain-containing protein n=1 Tax=Candidatus Enterococcus willemsii TaxID=1857215 RepID=A0ABQ6Z1V6_9ENTE|nr:ABC transporter ATP-binding protein [Enterococcus sp. CU12B]KAF1305519.1 hypothetical protein BAU17_07470 [Enterococcus sp. CU12B]
MTMIDVKDVSYKKRGKTILDNISFQLTGGKIVALLGENGAGKTSILRILAGLARGWKGHITIDDQAIGAKTKENVALLISLQDFPREMTIRQVMTFYQRFYADFDSKKVQELMAFMELDSTSKLKTLSRGQMEKAALAMTLARNAKVFLLDEPLSGIDLLSREKIIQSLLRWFNEEAILLMTTHQMNEIENIVDEVIIIADHKIAIHSGIEELRESQQLGLEGIYREIVTKG